MNKGRVYKIVATTEDFDENDTYYGSTIQPINKRYSEHKTRHKKECCSKLLFEKYGVENCKVELVEEIEFEDRKTLTDLEASYIRNNPCCNKTVPNRTMKEWLFENKEKVKQTSKIYYEANKDNIFKKHKEWYEANKDKINKKRKEQYEANRERLLQKRREYESRKKAEKII